MMYVFLLIAALVVGFFIGKILKKSENATKIVNSTTKLAVIALIIVVGSKFGASGVFREGFEIILRSGFIALLSSTLAIIISVVLLRTLTRRSDML
ncbi:MAG TPA: hypothetical protein ENI59_00205 [Euryarchaeota archaeon]|nr:hypothetical protein [Euryarchaeota archaeon]